MEVEVELRPETKSYELRFTPHTSGTHHIYTMLKGKVIKGATIKVKVESNNPVATYGCYGEDGRGKFNSPRAVAVDSDQSIYSDEFHKSQHSTELFTMFYNLPQTFRRNMLQQNAI